MLYFIYEIKPKVSHLISFADNFILKILTFLPLDQQKYYVH